MTTPDYILRFAEAIAPGNAELLLTGGTEEAILNGATDTISDLRERNAELEAQRDALLAACEFGGLFDSPTLLREAAQILSCNGQKDLAAALFEKAELERAAIAKARGDTSC